MLRIGHGYDLHRVGSDRPLVLGGIEVSRGGGPESHSDGDVLLHAVANALLGAIGDGDIGQHFPDSDDRWRDVASSVLVDDVMGRVRSAGFHVANLDGTVLAERPRLAGHRDAMREKIASLVGVEPDRVNVKFGTGEGVGPVGRGEAIAAHVVVLLEGR